MLSEHWDMSQKLRLKIMHLGIRIIKIVTDTEQVREVKEKRIKETVFKSWFQEKKAIVIQYKY